jgi:hypothetical protein
MDISGGAIMKFGRIYFAILGIVTLIFGIADFISTCAGLELSWGILEIPSEMFRGGWGGLVIIFAGIFYLFGIKDLSKPSYLSKILVGSILIWIMAGCDIFGMITTSIFSEGEGNLLIFFSSGKQFVDTYAPPYTPAIFLLPFSFFTIYYIYKYKKDYQAS